MATLEPQGRVYQASEATKDLEIGCPLNVRSSLLEVELDGEPMSQLDGR